jgi:hypothetical protein
MSFIETRLLSLGEIRLGLTVVVDAGREPDSIKFLEY